MCTGMCTGVSYISAWKLASEGSQVGSPGKTLPMGKVYREALVPALPHAPAGLFFAREAPGEKLPKPINTPRRG